MFVCVWIFYVYVCEFMIYVSSVSLCGCDHMSVGVSRGQEVGVSFEVWVTGDCEPPDVSARYLLWVLCKDTLNH